MKVNLKLSRVGMNMESATISVWHKKPGDIFRKGETLYEIESEKVTMEVDAPCDGKLLSHTVEAGNEATVGGNVCVIDTDLSA
jgi:pyruvate/2-oxoglutarate dehydrogenase complex dihydrolipoamide acyltransferase (E2) component